jgi:hypothetical protein
MEAGTEARWHVRVALTIPGVDRPMMAVFEKFIDELLKGCVTAAERRARMR